MASIVPADVPELLDALFRQESRRILASLIRLLGDFDLAEDGMHDAFAAALEAWPRDGVPGHPRAWLVSTGRFKAIDRLRRQARFSTPLDGLAEPREEGGPYPESAEEADLEDDRLRLVFICCHPALPPEASTALTLREVCGLTTEEIARAFLVAPSTLAQRIVRAKAKIREAGLPYEIPSRADLPDRLEAVLKVVYLVFNEGYSASSGEALTRPDLSGEAIRLGRLLLELLPDPEVRGLLALMLLQESRRAARVSPEGDLVLLEDQDRSRWDRALMAEGKMLVEQALASRRAGSYTLQAAIAAVHAEAAEPSATDWTRILGLYTLLARVAPSPVVDLNRAVAVAMRDGPQAGLDLTDALLARRDLAGYHLAHAVRADLCRRLGRTEEALASYRRALGLVQQGPERRFLERRVAELQTGLSGPVSKRTLPERPGSEGGRNDPHLGATMKYICFGYLDVQPWATLSQREQNDRFDACFTYDEGLRKDGHWVGGEGLQGPDTAVMVRLEQGKVSVTDGPYAETKELLGGILILEARDLNHAIHLISNHPGLKMGPWEIRPAADLEPMIRESERRRSASR